MDRKTKNDIKILARAGEKVRSGGYILAALDPEKPDNMYISIRAKKCRTMMIAALIVGAVMDGLEGKSKEAFKMVLADILNEENKELHESVKKGRLG